MFSLESVSLAPISPLSDTDTLPFGLLTPHQEFSTPKTLSLQDKAGSIVNETTPLITSKSSCQTDSELSTKCCTIRCSKFGKIIIDNTATMYVVKEIYNQRRYSYTVLYIVIYLSYAHALANIGYSILVAKKMVALTFNF